MIHASNPGHASTNSLTLNVMPTYLGRSWADVMRSWDPDSYRRPERYTQTMNSSLAPRVLGSIFVIVVACILGGAVHPALYLLALVALLFWL